VISPVVAYALGKIIENMDIINNVDKITLFFIKYNTHA
jgi:hypothetical protein